MATDKIYFDDKGHVHYTDPASEKFANSVDALIDRLAADGEYPEGWETLDLRGEIGSGGIPVTECRQTDGCCCPACMSRGE